MIKSIKKSLRDLLGDAYSNSLKNGALFFGELSEKEIDRLLDERIDFLPDQFLQKNMKLLEKVGTRVIPEMKNPRAGASTDAYIKASNIQEAPVGGLGTLRLGEDGKLHLISKSEHYHAPLGHNFPGYRLLERAYRLGINNATHNNTRGSITRFHETELIRTINGLDQGDHEGLNHIIQSKEDKVLNRVINMQTGSLAAEAGVKMMLARFYRLDKTYENPKYQDRIPVFFVMGDYEGGGVANYHGTIMLTQIFRDMWPELSQRIEKAGLMKVCPVNINDLDDFKNKMEVYNQ
ncbi:MAG TPA: hypothetical protein DDZ89_04775, partial [Clostridiales bacterium]|nr:hypothetical protein [Clostridiales bacterium]